MKDRILKWAEERNILKEATPQTQMLKVVEEVGELSKAILHADLQGIKDSIGDVAVTLIILAELCSMDYDKCLGFAYEEIKNRKGKMVRGTFVKEQ